MRYARLVPLLFIAACSSSDRVPADAPGFIKGKPIHPTIKIGRPYQINGDSYYPEYEPEYDEVGEASWYGPNFHGKSTANGEEYNQWAMTAAHKTLPMPSMVRVTRTDNDQSIVVRVNDRGPFAHGRIIDLSRAAAEALGVDKLGVAEVRVQYLKDETEEYIARLGLEKPDEWQMADARPQPPIIQPAQAEPEIATLDPAPLPSIPDSIGVSELEALPFATKSEAEIAQAPSYDTDPFAVLEKKAPVQPVSLVTPIASAKPEAIPSLSGEIQTGPTNKDRYFVQAGAFSKKENAVMFADRLSGLGATELVDIPITDGSIWRVRIGPLLNKGIAEEIKGQLHEYGVSDAQIVR
tara:strand:+ start:1301 stop:2356 length:1056 start_codon:yes stop_codon:yes gene_type:complete